MQPGIYTNLSSDQYHAAPGISNSGLSIIAERTPAHYKASLDSPRMATPAMIAGSRLHSAVLEPELFTQTYGVMPKCDLRTTAGKEAKAKWELDNPNRTAISADDYSQSMFIADILHANAAVRELLRGGHNERSVFAKDPETGVLVKCRPDADAIITGRRVLADLKTTERASPEDFMWSAYRYGYFRQAPLYTDVCNWEGSEQQVESFFFIAVEKEPPYAYIIYEAAPRFLQRGRDAYRTALNTYAECVAADNWPAYDTTTHTLDLPEAIHKRMDMADSDLVEDISYVE
jgi:exodeoxyribonuclease VIII